MLLTVKDFDIFRFDNSGGIYEGGFAVLKDILQGMFAIFQYGGVYLATIAFMISVICILLYSHKPKEIAAELSFLKDKLVIVAVIAGIVGIVSMFTSHSV